MFNIDKLDIIKGKYRDSQSYSFVGIKRNTDNKRLEFWLPINFENFPADDKENIRKFFFKIYKTLKIFTERNKKSSNYATKDRDGTIQAYSGLKISYTDKEDVICYGKITMLEAIISSFDEMTIASIIRKSVSYGEIKFDKIDRHLERAVYSYEDHSFYIDNMPSDKNVISVNTSTIVEMFCFIYAEIKKELQEEKEISNEVIHLSSTFKEKYLTSTSTIFGESFENTIIILKQVLDDIHRTVSYKDKDFWLLFDAIEKFLYGEFFPNDNVGEFWGINNFWAIWEDMCHTYSFSQQSQLLDSIIYADTSRYGNYVLENKKKIYQNKEVLVKNIFFFEFQQEKRYLYPDMVRYIDPKKEAIYDFNNMIKVNVYGQENSEYITVILEPTEHKSSEGFTKRFIEKLKKYSMIRKQNRKVRFEKVRKDIFFGEKQKALAMLEKQNVHGFVIIDYKYHSEFFYKNQSKKLKQDIVKQKVYELALKNWAYITGKQEVGFKHQFCIPYYSTDKELFPEKEQPEILIKNKIELIYVNFILLQEFYISNAVL